MENTPSLYAHVWLPMHGDGYTYAVPPRLQGSVAPGSLVRVPLGRRKGLTGLVAAVSDRRPEGDFALREVESEVYGHPVATARQLALWRWIADYYMCTAGDVLRAALPAALAAGGYRPPSITRYRLSEGDGARVSAKGRELLNAFPGMAEQGAAERSRLLQTTSATVVATLVKHRYLTEETRAGSHFAQAGPGGAYPALSAAQAKAYTEVTAGLDEGRTVLLHGVTASGKTELYLQLARRCLESGRKVLLLVPEIGLTTQLTSRLRAVFGDRLAAFHSRLSDGERAEVYDDLLRGDRFQVVVGVRSALFLPLDRFGLIVVDEEQEPSYKQYEPAPRYHARHTALMYAYLNQVPIVLGSATPSIESYHLARTGRYRLVELTERYGGVRAPVIEHVDREYAFRTNRMRGPFSLALLKALSDTLDEGMQAILFQNRRGFASSLECPQCGWVPKCPRCGVPLTYHKQPGWAECHYCGYKTTPPAACPTCGPVEMKGHGYGTEQVVEKLRELLPGVRAERLDTDAAQSKSAYDRAIKRFASGETQVLVGTQLIAKGFDFERVGLVGVINADNLLAFPDFRATERAFQVLTQVAGRAGRRDRQGRVILQSAQLEPAVLDAVLRQDFAEFYASQLEERRLFGYPPFKRIVEVTLRHKDEATLAGLTDRLGASLRRSFGDSLLGPQSPGTGLVNGLHTRQFLLKVNANADYARAKALIASALAPLRLACPALRVIIDVDPV